MTTLLRIALAGAFVVLAVACSTRPTEPIQPPATAPDPSAPADTATAADTAAAQQARAINRVLESTADNSAIASIVATFYADRDHAPVWFDASGRARPAVESLLESLAHADRQGLRAASYGHDALAAHVKKISADEADSRRIAALDARLSMVFVTHAMDLHRGRVRGRDRDSRWHHDLPTADYDRALTQAVRDGDVQHVLASLQPPHTGYALLVKALADYRDMVANGGWPTIADGETLATDMADPRVPALRERLRITGDLTAGPDATSAATSRTYDDELTAAVRHFQRRHGLEVDGRVGPNTRTALNVSAARRTRQIELNLERWRWLPADLGERYIMVNIPEYRLRAIGPDGPVLSMNVIVGGSYENRATPVFSDRMRYVIFRPYWNIPHSIATDEILPRTRRDHDYLARKHYQIVPVFGPNATPLPVTDDNLDRVANGDLHLRQTGGPHNSLGLIKFMFPNEYAVYLHDTPGSRLFNRAQRDFSHGCVRVQKPAALARFVLQGRSEWDMARIDHALYEGSRQRVNLAEPIPVYLIYWTAFVTVDGVQFRNDLYSHDDELDAALRRAQDSADASPGAI